MKRNGELQPLPANGQSAKDKRRIGWGAGILLICLSSISANAEHNHILPAPRETHYGEGRLSVGGLAIRLPQDATAEDRFSAQTLSVCLGGTAHPVVTAAGQSAQPDIFLHRTGSVDVLPVPGETPGTDSREAYTLLIHPSGAEIRARSSAGIYYGVQTLCQMIETGGTPFLPEAEIADWPALAYRGTMVDMSEGPLPRVAEIKRQIDLLARFKMNQYYFYNELTIALDDLPPAAPGARISKSDVRDIVAYARARHIDVVPCLELYGHLHDLFRREQYSDLADFPHGVEFNPENPRVQELLHRWAAEYMDLFPSPFVHIGFDETWQLRQAAQKGGSSPTQVFVEQLRKVSEPFRQQGKTVMAWADIMVEYPGIVAQLPPGLIAIPWYYDPRPDPEYKHWLAPLAAHHMPFMVAPGINSWNEIAPDYTLSFENIDTLIAAGRKSGALGVMNTIWPDDVQMLEGPVMPGIAYGAAAGWQQETVDRSRFFADYARIVYSGAAAEAMASALRNMAHSETALQSVLGQDTMLALWGSAFDQKTLAKAAAHAADLRRSRLLAEEAEEELLAAIGAGADASSLNAYLVECRLLDYAGLKFQYGVEISQAWKALGPKPAPGRLENDFDNIVISQQHGKLPDLMEAITELKPQYQQAWLEEYTPYRLAAALGRWDAEYEYLRRFQANLQRMVVQYDSKRGLPSFSSLLPSN